MVKDPPVREGEVVWSLGQEYALEEEMATHSNILACEILWTEEPGELQFMGTQRVRHDWAIEHILTKYYAAMKIILNDFLMK